MFLKNALSIAFWFDFKAKALCLRVCMYVCVCVCIVLYSPGPGLGGLAVNNRYNKVQGDKLTPWFEYLSIIRLVYYYPIVIMIRASLG